MVSGAASHVQSVVNEARLDAHAYQAGHDKNNSGWEGPVGRWFSCTERTGRASYS